MHIVVSNDNRLPEAIQTNPEVAVYTFNDFLAKTESEELDVEEGLWINVTYMDELTYGAIVAFFKTPEALGQANVLHFFKFADQPDPPYPISEFVSVYGGQPAEVPQPQSQVYQEPIQPQVVEQPPVAPAVPEQPVYVEPAPQPVPEPPVVQEPVAPQPTVPQPELPVTSIEQTLNYTPEIEDMQNELNIAQGGVYSTQMDITNKGTKQALTNLITIDDYDTETRPRKASPAYVYLIGSSKGGVGKTTTGLFLVNAYAKMHPNAKIAFADFDIIDGQIAVAIHKVSPTLFDFYKAYKHGKTSFSYLENCKVKSEHFGNVDFYLAPPQELPTITNDEAFWKTVFEHLIKNYDVVFFDSAIDYLEKKPVSMLYKIADKIFIVTNMALFSVKSIIKQLRTLEGDRKNDVFSKSMDIISRVRVILTRVSSDEADIPLNKYIKDLINEYAPVVGAFGNIDPIINKIQWYQRWELIDESVNPEIWDMLCRILADDEEE